VFVFWENQSPITSVSFSDGTAISIEKVEVGLNSLAPESITHKVNRGLIKTGVSSPNPHLPLDTPLINASSHSLKRPHFIKTSVPNQTDKSLFIWFSITNPKTVIPKTIEGMDWENSGFFYIAFTPYSIVPENSKNYLSLMDEHGCKISTAILHGIKRNDGSFIFCAEFPNFNRFSSKNKFTIDFKKNSPATFDITLPHSKDNFPSTPPPLPQTTTLPDGTIMYLDAWKFAKSSTPTQIEIESYGIFSKEYYYPNGYPTIRFLKETQDVTQAYGIDTCPIGDAFGSITDIPCAKSPGWFLRGNAYSIDLKTISESQKLIVKELFQLKDEEVREVKLPNKSLFRKVYLLGPGLYWFRNFELYHSTSLSNEGTLFNDVNQALKDEIRQNWDWITYLKANRKINFSYTHQIFYVKKPTVVFALNPLPGEMKLVATSSSTQLISDEFNWTSPYLGTADPKTNIYYDIAIDTSASVEIGLTEKYPFSFFFATDETMQEGAKEILIQK
jgi:hypothetical protein